MFKEFKADTESLFLLKSLEAEISKKEKWIWNFLAPALFTLKSSFIIINSKNKRRNDSWWIHELSTTY